MAAAQQELLDEAVFDEADAGGHYLLGVVLSVQPPPEGDEGSSGGRCLISTQEAELSEDIQADGDLFGPGTLDDGDVVAMRVSVGDDNSRPQALAPLYKLCGSVPDGEELCFDAFPLEGRVRLFTPAGDAIIQCDGAPQAIADAGVAQTCGLRVGDRLRFRLVDKLLASCGDDKRRIEPPCWRDCSPPPSENAGEKQDGASSGAAMQCEPGDTPAAGELVFGRVSAVNVIRGFSFVGGESLGFGKRDVFVHGQSADHTLLKAGDHVAWKLHLSKDGKPQGSAPFWKACGMKSGDEEASPPSFGRYFGRIDRLSADGHGFVECSAVKKEYGRDAFVFRKVIYECGLQVDDVICFDVFEYEDGKPQVKHPCWKCVSPPGPVLEDLLSQLGIAPGSNKRGLFDEGEATGGSPAKRLRASSSALFDVDLKTLAAATNDLHIGKVRPVDPSKGSGMRFLECSTSGVEADVFAHSSIVDPLLLKAGLQLAFKIHFDHEKRPQVCRKGPVWTMRGWLDGSSIPKIGKFVGQISNVTAVGSGEVLCEEATAEFGSAPSVHSKIMESLQLAVGDIILFNVIVGAKGVPNVSAPCWVLIAAPNSSKTNGVALSLGALVGGGPAAAVAGGAAAVERAAAAAVVAAVAAEASSLAQAPRQALKTAAELDTTKQAIEAGTLPMYFGWVRRANPVSGYGFIECPEADAKGVFMHSSVVHLDRLSAAGAVAFALKHDAQGRPQAAAPVFSLHGYLGEHDPFPALGTFAGAIRELGTAGLGVVANEEVREQFGCECIVHSKVMASCGLQVGDVLSFDLTTGGSGRPQVRAPMWRLISSSSTSSSAGPSASAASSSSTAPALTTAKSAPPTKVSDGRGFSAAGAAAPSSAAGYAESGPGALGRGGARGPAPPPGPPPGALLGAAAPSVARGRPGRAPAVAARPAVVRGRAGGASAEGPAPGAAAPLVVRGRPSEAPAEAAPRQRSDQAVEALDDVFLGTVLSVELQGPRRRALLDCSDFGLDRPVVVSGAMASLEQISADEMVAIRVQQRGHMDPEGIAPLWRMVGWPEGEDDELQFGNFLGTIRHINPQGNGLVDCPEALQSFDMEVSVLPETMEDTGLQVGDVVSFSVRMDEHAQRPWLAAPCWKCCSPKWAEEMGLGVRRPPQGGQLPPAVALKPTRGGAARGRASVGAAGARPSSAKVMRDDGGGGGGAQWADQEWS